MIGPTDCIENDFHARWYKKWANRLGYPVAKHPKFWESAIIVQLLKERKMLKKNMHAAVFGAGTEQLVSLFADMDIYVTATDQDPDSEDAKKWDNGQLAKDIKSLYYPDIVSEEKFRKHVTYKSFDMNKDEKSFYNKFDFIWHNCVVGHLGSMERSLSHLERSSRYIKDNGWLVFTTELNISNPKQTVDKDSDTIIWRLEDLYVMFERLSAVGLCADRLKLRLGVESGDTRINYDNGTWMSRDFSLLSDADYSEIKIAFANYAITQIVLSFKKTGNKKAQKILPKHKEDIKKNQLMIDSHIHINEDLTDYYTNYETVELLGAKIKPIKKHIVVDVYPGEMKKVALEFVNRSRYSVFGFGPHWPMNHPPLVLATNKPVNRDSLLFAPDWSSPNRPAITFFNLSTAMLPKKANVFSQRARQNEKFEYSFTIKSPTEAGVYKENFVLVFEGVGILEISEVELELNVKNSEKSKLSKMTVTAEKYFKVISWNDSLPLERKVKNDFLAWLNIFEKDSFSTRRYLSIYEFEIFLKSFIIDNGYNFKISKTAEYAIQASYSSYKIILNNSVNEAYNNAKFYFVISNPRSGNTVISEILQKIIGVPKIVGEFDDINLSNAVTDSIVQSHVRRSDFIDKYNMSNEYKVITVARHPLDTLISAFRFSQKTVGCIEWLDGGVINLPQQFVGLNPHSKAFEEWALSDSATNLFSVTYSWINDADIVIRYEDFIKNPEDTIIKAMKGLGIETNSQKIKIGTKEVKENFLVGYHNEHRWTGGMDNWQKYISKDLANKIYKKHKKVFKKLGYQLEYPVEYSELEIIENNKNWS